MPIAAAAGSGWQVRIQGRIDGQLTENVYDFICETATTNVEVNLILVIAQCFIDNLLPVLSSAWALEKVVWKQVMPTLGPEFTSVPVGAGAGAGPAAALPSFNSAVVSLRTAAGGRSKRGRKFIAGLPEAATLNSAFDTANAFWTGLVNYCVCLVTHFVGLGDPPPSDSFSLCVYSRKLGSAKFPYTAAGYERVVDIAAQTRIGSTNSRKVGRGA